MPAHRRLPTRPRSGTMLLFCIVAVTFLAVVVYSFLRAVELQRNEGSANTFEILAREAALTGTRHAMEELARDYTTSPLTTIDMPGRSCFLAMNQPWGTDPAAVDAAPVAAGGTDPRLIDYQDTPCEHRISRPIWGYASAWWLDSGLDNPYGSDGLMWFGRGRYYEPEHYNLATRSAGATQPTVAARFGDGDGEDLDGPGTGDIETGLTDPTRNAPPCWDAQWHILPLSTPALADQARQLARYRLRYALGCRDLDGNLTINAEPGIDWRMLDASPAGASIPPGWTPTAETMAVFDANQDGTLQPGEIASMLAAHQRVARAARALPNIVLPMTSYDFQGDWNTTGPKAAHLLMGRGSIANYARYSANDPAPRTFPLMYRMPGDDFRLFSSQVMTPYYAPNPPISQATTLFANTTSPGATGSPAGWEPLAATGGMIWRAALTGEQFSFFDITRAMRAGNTAYPEDFGWDAAIWQLTPFQRGANGGAGQSGGPADTPWVINLMTAPVATMRGLVMGYLPPGAMQIHHVLNNGSWPTAPLADPDMVPSGSPLGGPPMIPPTVSSGSNSVDYFSVTRLDRNLFVSTQSPAFARYAPPQRTSSVPPVSPDYQIPAAQVGEPGYLPPAARYPGAAAFDGMAPDGSVVSDGLASLINVGGMPRVYDPYTNTPMYHPFQVFWDGHGAGNPGGDDASPPNDTTWNNWQGPYDPLPTQTNPNGTYPSTYGRMTADYCMHKLGLRDDSFWKTIMTAYSNAWAVARRGQSRFPTRYYQPNAGDAMHTNPVCAPTTTAGFDRLFLLCLGIDIANPSSPVPATGWCGDGGGNPVPFTPSYNIAGLAALPDVSAAPTVPWSSATSAAAWAEDLPGTWWSPAQAGTVHVSPIVRTAAMELMLNDFRLSFFGCDPAYVATFRPLDFNGDGVVTCSCYAAGRATTPDESTRALLGLDQQSVSTGGAGDWDTAINPAIGVTAADMIGGYNITPFCVTGHVRIGRSHFWEVQVRGEVFDNLMKRPVTSATVQTVFVLDPTDEAGLRGNPGAQEAAQTLFQRWQFDSYRALVLDH
jgi:hypothetical protein